MSLKDYQGKRDFQKTPEPEGGESSDQAGSRFVIHYHQSRRPHYDLRLEAHGVLKSWAIPKGPSLNPEEKHLAVRVEDHPLGYRNFEGNIPAANYGAGTVMIWDEGFYHPLTPGEVSENIEKGHLAFLLSGQKLKGEFALVRLRKAAPDDWLLIKAADDFASRREIKDENLSARSGRSLAEIREAQGANDFTRIEPMLATLTEEAFDNDDWLFEIKWDGFRALANIRAGEVDLYSRNLKPLNERFPSVAVALAKIKEELTVDGEIVAVDSKGHPSFQALAGGEGRSIVYYVFDLLRLGQREILSLPIEKRREMLEKISRKWPENIRFSEAVTGDGRAFYQAAREQNLEGIIAKKKGSRYQPGKRSRDWLKIKITATQEAVIGGYTPGVGGRLFGSLLLGLPDRRGLHYIGNVGTGWTEKSMGTLMTRLKGLRTEVSPFDDLTAGSVAWVRPVLVAEIKYQEWTREGHLRQPVFLGLREDKNPAEVRREVPGE